MSETGFVYILVDPRDDEPRYVGATTQPEQRLNSHRTSPTNDDMREWFKSLEAEGLEPVMRVASVCPLEELDERETRVLKRVMEEYEVYNRKFDTTHTERRDTDKKMVKANIPEAVHQRLRERKAEENCTLQEATEEALREWYESDAEEAT